MVTDFSPVASYNINSSASKAITVPSLPDDVAQEFIKKHTPIAWRFDADGREIPGINPDALKIRYLQRDTSTDFQRQIFRSDVQLRGTRRTSEVLGVRAHRTEIPAYHDGLEVSLDILTSLPPSI